MESRVGSGVAARFLLLSEADMSTSQWASTRTQRAGLVVFALAVVGTAAMITMGVFGIPWPKWLLALTTVF